MNGQALPDFLARRDFQSDLFANLAHQGLLLRLAVFDAPADETPISARSNIIRPANHQIEAGALDDRHNALARRMLRVFRH